MDCFFQTIEGVGTVQSEAQSVVILTAPSGSQQASQAANAKESPAPGSSQFAQLKLSSLASTVLASPGTDALQKTPERAQRKRKAEKSDRSQPAMLDFSTLGGFPSTSMDSHSACSSSTQHAPPPPPEQPSGNSRMTVFVKMLYALLLWSN